MALVHSTRTSETGSRHLPALDGLRGLAVLAVVAYHLWPDALPGGWLGVDVFFVLSGYLITSLLLVEREGTGHVSLARFWARRARRLLPALAVVLVVVALAARAWWDPWRLASVRGDGVAAVLYVANWRFVATGDSYFASGNPSPLQHLWSLGIEEQFYLLWPLVLLGLWRLGRGRRVVLAAMTAALAAASAITMGLLANGGTGRAYYGADTRAQAVLAGAALAFLLPTGTRVPVRLRAVLTLVGAAGLAVLGGLALAVPGSSAWLYRGGFALIALCGTATVAGVAAGGRLGRLLARRGLPTLGRVSYGLYLWHWPVIIFLTPARTGLEGAALSTMRIVVFSAFTAASYHLVERPVRIARLRPAFVAIGSPATLGIAAVALLLGTAGAAPAPRQLQARAGTVVTVPPAPEPASSPTSAAPARPRWPRPDRVLVVGDEVAGSIAPALIASLAEHGVDAAAEIQPGCGVALGTQLWVGAGVQPTCPPRPSTAETSTGGRAHTDAVLLLSTTESTTLRGPQGEPLGPSSDGWTVAVHDGLAQAIDRVKATGARPILVVPPVQADSPERNLEPLDIVTDQIYAEAVVDVARARGVQMIDLGAVVCPHTPCELQRDGVVLRPDGRSFSEAGARLVAAPVVEALLDPPEGEEAPPLQVEVVGDSVALTLGLYAGPVPGLRIRGGGIIGCGIAVTKRCDRWLTPWRNAARHRPEVVVVSIGPWELAGPIVAGHRFRAGDAEYRSYLLARLEEAVDVLPEQARLVLLDVPCLSAPGGDGLFPPDDVAWLNGVLETFANEHAERAVTVPISELVCPGGRPRDELFGVELRPDNRHYDEQSAPIAWRWLAPRLRAAAARLSPASQGSQGSTGSTGWRRAVRPPPAGLLQGAT